MFVVSCYIKLMIYRQNIIALSLVNLGNVSQNAAAASSAIKPAKTPAVPMRSDDAAFVLLELGVALVLEVVATTVTVLPEPVGPPLLVEGTVVTGTEVVIDVLPLDAVDTLEGTRLGVETPMTVLVKVGEMRL